MSDWDKNADWKLFKSFSLRRAALGLTWIFVIMIFFAILIEGLITKNYDIFLYWILLPFTFLIYCLVFGHADTITNAIKDKK
jgi:hypothetical protein